MSNNYGMNMSFEDFVDMFGVVRGFCGLVDNELEEIYDYMMNDCGFGRCPNDEYIIEADASKYCKTTNCRSCWRTCINHYLENNSFWRL